MSTTTVLARKWRPKNFAQLAGQEHVVKALSNALTQNRLHHAYLFTGTRGVGKTTIARIFAKSLNCETGITATPCGICRACTDIDSGRFVDLIELDAASNTQVDSMRELLESALYAPSNARFKVYIIDEVHMLSKSAFNAMLKTLEEPPAHVKFILATTDPQKIPVTVLSRCLQFNLKQLPPLLIARHLQYVLEQEHIDFEIGAINLVARAAQGSMRDALSLMDQAIAFSDSHVAESVVRSMLGAIDQSYLFELLEQLQQQNGMGLMAIADNMATRSIAFESALQELATLLHRIALAQTVPQAIADDEPERMRLLDLATAFTPEDIQLYYQIAIHGRAEIELAPDEYAGFTMTLLRMLAFAPSSRERGREKGEGNGARVVPPIPAAAPVYQEPVAPIATPAPAAAPQPRLSSDTLPDWGTLLGQLNMQGMALQLAKHCVLDSFSNGQMTLCLAEEFKHLQSNKPAIDRLQTTLSDHLGQVIKVQIVLGKPQVATPAHVENQVKQAMQQQANESIAQDTFVREAQDQLAAKIIPDSIKSIN
ncbi:MAG: DNA polymerase III subunit gamma/tau [Gallionella sp.]|nr:DNA polymerase III subunit gamma/tau [Gallionella sp.]